MTIRYGTIRLTFHKNRLLYWFLLIPFCLPDLVYYNSITSAIAQGWRIIVIVYSLLVFIKQFRKYIVADWVMFLFFGLMAVVSLLNGEIPGTTLSFISVYILFQKYIGDDAEGWLQTFVRLIWILAVLNLITILVFPDGMYTSYSDSALEGYTRNWLMGYKNPMIRILLPGCAVSHIYSMWFHKRRIFPWLFTLVVLLTMILVDSAAGLAGIIIFSVLVLLYQSPLRRIISHWRLMASFVLTCLIDVVFIIFRKQEIFNFIIDDLLHRSSSSMAGRTYIWDIALKFISQKPYFGYGEASSTVMTAVGYSSHPHNYILYVLIQTGVIGLLILIWLIILCNNKMRNCSRANLTIAGCLVSLFTAFWIMGIAESLTGALFFYPMFIFFRYLPGSDEEEITDHEDQGNT